MIMTGELDVSSYFFLVYTAERISCCLYCQQS